MLLHRGITERTWADTLTSVSKTLAAGVCDRKSCDREE